MRLGRVSWYVRKRPASVPRIPASVRHPGNALLAIGVLVGVVSGVWIGVGATAGSLPWLIGVGPTLIAARSYPATMTRRRDHEPSSPVMRLWHDLDVPIGSVHANPLAITN